MHDPHYIDTPQGRRIACRASAGAGPGIAFLGGLRSDMEGTKAAHLHGWARARGRAFLRLDYSGHGASSGRFEEGAVGDWLEDALAAIEAVGEGPRVLVGSSLGGWIALLIARERPDLVAGLVTIAAAPDFTEDMAAEMGEAARAEMAATGIWRRPSDYGEPYPIGRRLIGEGRARLIFPAPLRLQVPMRMLQGTADADVPTATALRLLDHLEGEDVRLTLVRGADHRFSTPACLALIEAAALDASP